VDFLLVLIEFFR